jgi:hypothetical protein
MPIKVTVSGISTPLELEEPGPSLSEVDVDRFEARLGYRLPAEYREFLLKYNAGSPVSGEVRGRDDDRSVPYAHGDAVRTLYKLAPVQEVVPSYEALRTPNEGAWRLPGDVLPIGEDACGNLFVLELGRRGTAVRFLNHERLDEPLEEHRVLADDFLDFTTRFVPLADMRAREDAAREALRTGSLPPKLEAQCEKVEREFPDVRTWIRVACLQVFDVKANFSLHNDRQSRLVFDVAAWLASRADGPVVDGSPESCKALLAPWWRRDVGGLGMSSIAVGFVKNWWDDRLANGRFEPAGKGYRLTPAAEDDLLQQLGALGAP